MNQREALQKRLDRVHEVVARGDPTISAAITQATVFLRAFVANDNLPKDQLPTWDPPEAFDNPLLTDHRFQDLGGKTPLMALRQIVDDEKHHQEKGTLYASSKTVPAPVEKPLSTKADATPETVDVFVATTDVFVADAAPEISEEKSQPPQRPPQEKKPKADFFPPEGHSRGDLLVARFPHLPRTLARMVLRGIPFIHCGPHGRFYDEARAVAALTVVQEEYLQQKQKEETERERVRAAKEAAKKTRKPKTRRRAKAEKKAATPFTAPDGYITRSSLYERFPNLPLVHARNALRSIQALNGGPHGWYYNETSAVAALTAAQEEYLLEKDRAAVAREQGKAEKAARPKKEPAPYNPPAGYVRRTVIFAEFPELSREEASAALHSLPDIKLYRGAMYVQPDTARARLTAARDEKLSKLSAGRVVAGEKKRRTHALRREHTVTTQPDSNDWERTSVWENQYGIGHSTINNLLAEVPFVYWNGTTYYDKNRGTPLLEAYKAKKATEGIYLRKNKKYVTIHYLHKTYGISYDKLRTELETLTPLTEDHLTLYLLRSAHKKLDHLIKVPAVDKKSGIYKDPQGEEWAPYTVIADILGMSYSKTQSYLPGLPSIEVRARSRQITDAYKISAVRESAAEYLSAPAAEPKPTTDSSRLVGTDYLAEKSGLPVVTVRNVLGTGTRIRGAGRRMGYAEADALARLEAFKAMPKVDQTGMYAKDDRRFAEKRSAVRLLRLSWEAFDAAVATGQVEQIDGRGETNMFPLYCLDDLQNVTVSPAL